jgi:hypothetical protein
MKIAFSIQQLLVLLDASARAIEKDPKPDEKKTEKREMSKWLYDRLVDSKVYETIEPFWSSEFSERTEGQQHQRRPPPFFKRSSSYYFWISQFCRWMILNAKDSHLCPWKDFFYACRNVVRSMTGLETSEFILPLLIADRICYGTHEEFASISTEFLDILDFDSDGATQMDPGGRQKAVNAFFHVFDTLSYWAEQETELRCRSSRSASSSSRSKQKEIDAITTESAWAADETITQIREFIGKIPLLLQAKAASNVGMHARAL